METPPRAWGRHQCGISTAIVAGNTPTGVGKTELETGVVKEAGKHPHGRGEDLDSFRGHALSIETPPRAWGRRAQGRTRGGTIRNTPTGVGKTTGCRYPICGEQKHPHGRGEDESIKSRVLPQKETPPRAWGRPDESDGNRRRSRNTPTGVGKTRK